MSFSKSILERLARQMAIETTKQVTLEALGFGIWFLEQVEAAVNEW